MFFSPKSRGSKNWERFVELSSLFSGNIFLELFPKFSSKSEVSIIFFGKHFEKYMWIIDKHFKAVIDFFLKIFFHMISK